MKYDITKQMALQILILKKEIKCIKLPLFSGSKTYKNPLF